MWLLKLKHGAIFVGSSISSANCEQLANSKNYNLCICEDNKICFFTNVRVREIPEGVIC